MHAFSVQVPQRPEEGSRTHTHPYTPIHTHTTRAGFTGGRESGNVGSSYQTLVPVRKHLILTTEASCQPDVLCFEVRSHYLALRLALKSPRIPLNLSYSCLHFLSIRMANVPPHLAKN